MKKLLIGLLLVNVVLFAALQWGGHLLDSDKAATAALLHADKIQIVSAPEATSVSSAVVVETPPAPVLSCMEWSDFSGSDLTRANEALATLKLGNKLTQRPIEYSSGYWVYLAPIKDKLVLARKIEQLKTRGVTEYFVVQEPGEWLHAISLGVFKSEESAQHYLATLQTMGVHNAKVGERSSKLKATIFVLKQLDDAMLNQLKTLQKDFPNSELKRLECEKSSR